MHTLARNVPGLTLTEPTPASPAPHQRGWLPAAWTRVLAPLPLQAKLTVNQPGDIYEQEADRVATQVMRMPDPAAGMVRRCACGGVADATGECPACRAKRLGLQRKSDASDGMAAPPSVHETLRAPGRPLDGGARAFMESRFGHDFGGVRVHTDSGAAASARAVGAQAYTVGQNVVFGEGRYAPGTDAGKRLIAHELAHVVQQGDGKGSATVQRQEVINMPPETIISSLRGVEDTFPHLDSLRGAGRNPDGPVISHDPAAIQRNVPDPARRLPFTGSGWDAQVIMTALGQYDSLPGTDSDAFRCVQAVAMAARIPQGPAAVVSYLNALILEGLISRPQGQRQRTAMNVMRHVSARIENRRATFGDLLWAQEAMHDLFYNDVSGTPRTDIAQQIGSVFDMNMQLQSMSLWCNNPTEVMNQAATLQPGEQLLVNTWQVLLNTAFDYLEEKRITVATGDSIVVRVNGRRVRIRRIPTDRRPPHTAIDSVRDHQSGHQLLVLRDGATRQLRLYEPELTDSGQHLETLQADGSNFQRYFTDQPRFGIYNYIEILGKLTPRSTPTFGATP